MVLTLSREGELSSPTWQSGWRIMATLFPGDGFAAGVTRCSGFVPIVTEASAIAACRAEFRRASNNAALPTAAISRVRKDGRTIATGSGSTGTAVESGPA